MFEGTGLSPLVLFPSASDAAAAKKLWDTPEARVQALVPEPARASAKPAKAKKKPTGGGGGFGAKKGPAGPAPLTRVPAAAEVVRGVANCARRGRARQPSEDVST